MLFGLFQLQLCHCLPLHGQRSPTSAPKPSDSVSASALSSIPTTAVGGGAAGAVKMVITASGVEVPHALSCALPALIPIGIKDVPNEKSVSTSP